MTLLSSAQKYIQSIQNVPLLCSLTPEKARVLRQKERALIQDDQVQTEDITIVTRDQATIGLRIYTPKAKTGYPAILYIHGGGWVINSVETSHESCLQLAKKSKSQVISVEYRLAPEFKFPIPLHDCHDAYLWVKKEQKRLQHNGLIFVAGDSAGGNLASALTQLPEGEGITGQILLYPVTSLTYDTPSYEQFACGYGLDKSVMQWFGNHYITNDLERYDARISLLNAKIDYAPPAFIIVSEYDVLRDEGIAYAEKLAIVNGQSELLIKGGLVHSYFTKNEFFAKEIDETIDDIYRFMTSVLHRKTDEVSEKLKEKGSISVI